MDLFHQHGEWGHTCTGCPLEPIPCDFPDSKPKGSQRVKDYALLITAGHLGRTGPNTEWRDHVTKLNTVQENCYKSAKNFPQSFLFYL